MKHHVKRKYSTQEEVGIGRYSWSLVPRQRLERVDWRWCSNETLYAIVNIDNLLTFPNSWIRLTLNLHEITLKHNSSFLS